MLVLALLASPLVLAILTEATQPVEELLRGFIYAAKDIAEKFLLQWKPAQLSIKQNNNGIISFQMDTDTQPNPAEQCPMCRIVDNQVLVGSWNVVLWSRNFLLNTMLDLDMVIDKLEGSKPISGQKTLYEWLASPPPFRCPQLIVLDENDSTKFELAYRVANADQKSKSIVGRLERNVDGTYLWQIAPTISLQVCVALAPKNPYLKNSIANERSSDFVVLNQLNSWPKCENFIVLMRNLDSSGVENLRQYLEEQKAEGVFNKLEKSEFDTIRPLSYADANVFLLCFSVAKPESLSAVFNRWLPELRAVSPSTPVILVGTQSDLRLNMGKAISGLPRSKASELVEWRAASRIAGQLHAEYLECSAITHHNLKEVFDLAILEGLSRKTPVNSNIPKQKVQSPNRWILFQSAAEKQTEKTKPAPKKVTLPFKESSFFGLKKLVSIMKL